MVDPAWRKLIIKVECAKNPDNEKHTAPDADTLGSTVYICRQCPSFRTLAKETVNSHLSKVHHIEVKPDSDPLSPNPCTSPTALSDHRSPPLSPSVPVCVTQSSIGDGGSGEGIWSCSSPLPSPHSPVSPLIKECWQPRKKITVTLNASPTFSLARVTSTISQSEGLSPGEVNQPEMNSFDVLTYRDPAGSSVDTSSSTIRSTSSSPEFRPKPSTQILYECQFCDQGFVRLKSFEKHKIRHHRDLTLDSLQHDAAQSTLKPSHDIIAKPKHHTKLQQVPCQECGRVFSSKQACDLHARVHRTTKSKYKCALCSSIFRNLGSLKRHAISAHSIVPESVFTDNPKDKDFDVSDTDSCSSSSSGGGGGRCTGKTKRGGRRRRPGLISHSQQHVRTNLSKVLIRNIGTTAVTVTSATTTIATVSTTTTEVIDAPPRRRRGRPRRSQTRVKGPLATDNHLVLSPVEPLQIASRLDESRLGDGRGETRYRTILPRPPGGTGSSGGCGGDGTGSDSAKFLPPITVERSHRKRSKRSSKKNMHRPATLVPLLIADRGVYFERNRMASTEPTHTVYLDQYQMAPTTTYVTLDPTTYQTNNTYSQDLVATDDSVEKPPHVLTVAAAYASQLPIGSIPTAGTTDETDAEVKIHVSSTECQLGDGNSSALAVQSTSIIPSIQIYPSPWADGQMQAVVPGAVNSVSVSETDLADLHPSTPTASMDPNLVTQCSTSQMSIPVGQPLQLYPVLGPDGVTTMYYYMTTPVELVQQDPTGAQITVASELNTNAPDSGPTDVSEAPTATPSYYCTYSNPMQWVSHTTESGELTVVSVPSSCCPNITTTTYDPAADDTFELEDLFEQNNGTQQPDTGSSAFDSESSRAVQHVSLDCIDQTIHDGEKIEVIELDAVQFGSVLCATQDAHQDAEVDSGADSMMVPTEVVDLGVARELDGPQSHRTELMMEQTNFVNSNSAYASSSLEELPEAYAIDTVTTTEQLPAGSLATKVTQDLALENSSLPHSLQDPTADPSDGLPTMVTDTIQLVHHPAVHTNIPCLTQLLLSQTRGTVSSLNELSSDTLHTPLIENREAFDFPPPCASSDHDTTAYASNLVRNSNVCS